MHYIQKRGWTLERTILWGRHYAWKRFYTPDKIRQTHWHDEIAASLSELGLIRSDIGTKTFRLGALYNAVYRGAYDPYIPAGIAYLKTNELYEAFVPVTAEQVYLVLETIDELLEPIENEILMLRFRLMDYDDARNVSSLAQTLGMTDTQILWLEKKALGKLRGKLPPIFVSVDGNSEVVMLASELRSLRNDPIFKKEREIVRQLQAMSRSPFTYSEKAARFLCNE